MSDTLRWMKRNRPALFKGRHFEAEIIVLCVRWYLRFGLSFRNLEEMMAERNLHVDHVTIWRWVQRYAPELNRRCRQELRPTNGSWRVDETYLRVAGKWTYLYRAVDSTGCAYRKFHLWAEAVAHKAANQLSGHALLHGTIVKHEKSAQRLANKSILPSGQRGSAQLSLA